MNQKSIKTGNNWKIILFGKDKINQLIKSRESGLFLALIAVCAILSFSTDTFLNSENLFNVLKQVSLVTIVAAGQTFIIISGGIDLSVGSILGLSGITMSYMLQMGIPVIISVPAAIATGLLLGLSNGLLITKLRLPPFIITLGMASICKGLVLVITKGFPIEVDSSFVIQIGQGYWGPVPIMAVVMLCIIALAIFILEKTVFGNRVKAIGGNELAASLSGINVNRTKLMIYSLAGLFCGIAGVIMTGRLNAGNPNAGLNFDMDSIAATIVGGTSLSGGAGSILGTMLGALLLGVIRNGLVLLNVNMYWQTVVTGSIIILVCALDRLTNSKKA